MEEVNETANSHDIIIVTKEAETETKSVDDKQEEKQKDLRTSEPQNDEVKTIQIKKDIYNTYAILRATMIETKVESNVISESMWNSSFTTEDKFIFCFFLFLIIIIQVGGFMVLYNDATDLVIIDQLFKGTPVYLDDGIIDFTLGNNGTYNYTMDIQYGQFSLLYQDPKLEEELDKSLLFSILVADVCLVFYMIKGVSKADQLKRLASYLPHYAKQKKLVQTLTVVKLLVWVLGSYASLSIVALAKTSIEAFANAIAVFFLVETSEWVYGLIRAHPAINDELYNINVDLSVKLDNDDDDKEAETEEERALRLREYEIYTQLIAEKAFLNVFIQTSVFLLLFIGIQFWIFLEYVTFGIICLLLGLAFVIWMYWRLNRFQKRAKEQAKTQTSLTTTIHNSDNIEYH